VRPAVRAIHRYSPDVRPKDPGVQQAERRKPQDEDHCPAAAAEGRRVPGK